MWYNFTVKKKRNKDPIKPVSGTKEQRFAGPTTFARLPELRDVEFEIKYLMGKNYHRSFVDEDLGPYEFANE